MKPYHFFLFLCLFVCITHTLVAAGPGEDEDESSPWDEEVGEDEYNLRPPKWYQSERKPKEQQKPKEEQQQHAENVHRKPVLNNKATPTNNRDNRNAQHPTNNAANARHTNTNVNAVNNRNMRNTQNHLPPSKTTNAAVLPPGISPTMLGDGLSSPQYTSVSWSYPVSVPPPYLAYSTPNNLAVAPTARPIVGPVGMEAAVATGNTLNLPVLATLMSVLAAIVMFHQ
ncbi:uncharacterized protein BYT42DRAFT_604245 [Radiomyces spectabilis]|uniref:uncharacterized protein n=1 Tax=Radiomyces spectabilis TaxID=64574 RepID=UPI00221FEE68|nr:uncharacterized protein BYT42DRAFT_604245 [Radiomyces spectabilis]KAI8381250.1 hypothetical protein BYT42DRAFT_604245 [Radiomyces spectabilis]